jgi:hypothetical protein
MSQLPALVSAHADIFKIHLFLCLWTLEVEKRLDEPRREEEA